MDPVGAIGLLLLGALPVGWVDRLTATAVGWLSIPDRFASRLGSLAFGAGLESDPQRLALARESAADLQRRELSSAIAGKEELRQRGGLRLRWSGARSPMPPMRSTADSPTA